MSPAGTAVANISLQFVDPVVRSVGFDGELRPGGEDARPVKFAEQIESHLPGPGFHGNSARLGPVARHRHVAADAPEPGETAQTVELRIAALHDRRNFVHLVKISRAYVDIPPVFLVRTRYL